MKWYMIFCIKKLRENLSHKNTVLFCGSPVYGKVWSKNELLRHDVIRFSWPMLWSLKWFAIYGQFYHDVKMWSWTLKIFKNFKKFFNESSSNLKMTFWIKIRNNSASTYNRFVSSWKRDEKSGWFFSPPSSSF